ncbi:diguanylate cyclase domain-containing protein [Deinococcus hohokamensis]|uniref:Diguanylate cyclase domain-containing protein n=1 Tax=Deinococcus hohokamensis TaxID=309883 RepID=A0ABV9IFB1_9DEIO
MPSAPLPEHEYARLLELARYDILDTAPEVAFDRLTRLAARTLRAPAAIINFVDQDRQWGKSCFGTGDSTAPRADSFCAWTILSDEVLAVPDTSVDPRFQNNRQVTGEPHIRMYAGAPLITPGGYRLGSICVIDTQPRVLTEEDHAALQDLAALVMDELELRLRNRMLEAQIDQQGRELRELQQTVAHAQVLEEVIALMDAPLSPQEATLAAARLIGTAIYADWTGLVSFQGEEMTMQVAHNKPQINPALLDFAARLPLLPGGVTRALRETTVTTYLEDYAQHPGALKEGVAAGLKSAAWLPLGHYGDASFMLIAVRAERGDRAPWRASDRALLDAAGRSVRAALLRHTALESSARAARQDRLTGIGNRRAFDTDFAARQAAAQPFLVGLIDLDGFKRINDVEGHAQGDRVLQMFATVLQDEVGASGQAYRYGGDEFALLLSGLCEDEALEHVDLAVVAARQLTALPLGASVGFAWAGAADETGGAASAPSPEQVLALADERMYEVKRRRQQRHLPASPSKRSDA